MKALDKIISRGLLFFPYLLIGSILFITGCEETEQTPSADPGTAGTLNLTTYSVSIDGLLAATCGSTLGCHGAESNRGGQFRVVTTQNTTLTMGQEAFFVPSLSGMANNTRIELNYISAQANSNLAIPSASTLLLKPLSQSAGGVTHEGGVFFANTASATYVTLLNWISNPV